MEPQTTKPDYLPMLDGLRGLMALWVFFGHVELWSLGKVPPWGSPAIAVDIFMLLSGFLMAFHWELRRKHFQTVRGQMYDFYLRRFFRIAPLYYVLLAVAFIWQSNYMEMGNYIWSVTPPPWINSAAKTASYTIDLPNVLSHVSFLFGFVPKYASNTILPDWSIGLEMQFYMLFPFLMLAMARFGAFTITVVSLGLVIATQHLLGLYREPGMLGNFPQPSMILFRLNIFVAGMGLALFYLNREKKAGLYFLVAAALSLMTSAWQVKASAAFIAFMLYFGSEHAETLYKLVTGRIARFLGDTSYSVYLVHKLVMLPGLYLLFHWSWFMARGSYARLGIAFSLLAIVVYAYAYLLFRFVEQPGIRLGRRLLQRKNPQRPAPKAPQPANS